MVMKIKNTRTKIRKKRIYAVSFLALALVISTILSGFFYFFSPEKKIEKKIEMAAKDYYENYLYKNLAKQKSSEEIKKILRAENGKIAMHTTLKKIILLDGGKNLKLREEIAKNERKCDEDLTQVEFMAKEPFTKSDYTLIVQLACQKK